MTEKKISEYEFSNRFIHWSLVAVICLIGIGASIGVNRKIFNDDTKKLPYRVSFEEIKADDKNIIISFSLKNESSGTIARKLFDFDLYIDDVHVAEGRLDSDAPAKGTATGQFAVPRETLEPRKHILTLLARMDRPLTRPVHYVANRKWELSP